MSIILDYVSFIKMVPPFRCNCYRSYAYLEVCPNPSSHLRFYASFVYTRLDGKTISYVHFMQRGTHIQVP